MALPTDCRRGVRIVVSGRVQGVGFRPFVHRLATELGVDGTVRNAGGSVVIKAAGDADSVDRFITLLRQRSPELARIDHVDVNELPADPRPGFVVLASTSEPAMEVAIPPDLATCPACVRELFGPADRRHRYPFITCTACGPRATILDSLPYDRQRTTIRGFPLCPRCAVEYHDPADRRFHAEPIACPDCGPRLSWYPTELVGEDASTAAVTTIAAGGIVAVKGIGGYQLICDEAAVARLRSAKHRPAKPFAVMVPNITAVARLCTVDRSAARLLRSPSAPIVLLPRLPDVALARSVAPDLPEIGVFLPYSPLHHLLLAALAMPLVVTSGNLADEPIAIDDAVTRVILGPIVDRILSHDRPIRVRHDDSVVRVLRGRPSVVRRARGYAPDPLPLPCRTTEPVLAVGAQLKHTAALAVGDRVDVGPHTGDLSDTAAFDAFTLDPGGENS